MTRARKVPLFRIGLGFLGAVLLGGSFQANAAHTCTVGVGNIGFGGYTGTQISSSSTMTVTCTLTAGITETVNFTATLSTGPGTYAQRLLTHVGPPADTLPYNLYQGAVPGVLNTNVWGDGTAGTTTATGSMNLIVIFNPTRSVTFTVAGAMGPVAAMPTAGTYSASVAATVTYN
jgi:spore coat protein U domain-containing protein, fimbrial subunit CupE1/2/3/6